MAKTKDPRLDNFPKRWATVLDKLCNGEGDADPFLDDVQQMSKEDLDKLIVKFNENQADFKKDMDADMDLANKKEAVAEAAAVYKDGIKVNEAKAMYCVYLKRSL
jgi:hypothetical protein